jgi:hypothetical protein
LAAALPLTGYPDFATWQPFLDEIITHPGVRGLNYLRALANYPWNAEDPDYNGWRMEDVWLSK